MKLFDLSGKVAIVTGGNGGIGLGMARGLSMAGAAVAVVGRNAEKSAAAVAELSAMGSGGALAVEADVSKSESVTAMVAEVAAKMGRIDILVNNAGILRDKSFVKLEPKNLEIVIDVHLKGAFFVSQPAFRAMKENNYGRFVFTASGAGIFGNFGQSNYGAAKMGLVGLSNVLAIEGARNNIKCHTIAPIAHTRLTEKLLGPLAEQLDPSHVTPLVVYLVSEACELTHEIFDVGGGRYARIFLGMGKGWTAPKDTTATAEDIAANLDDVRSTDDFVIPNSIADEMAAAMEALKTRA